jgi:hypothetical protein
MIASTSEGRQAADDEAEDDKAAIPWVDHGTLKRKTVRRSRVRIRARREARQPLCA